MLIVCSTPKCVWHYTLNPVNLLCFVWAWTNIRIQKKTGSKMILCILDVLRTHGIIILIQFKTRSVILTVEILFFFKDKVSLILNGEIKAHTYFMIPPYENVTYFYHPCCAAVLFITRKSVWNVVINDKKWSCFFYIHIKYIKETTNDCSKLAIISCPHLRTLDLCNVWFIIFFFFFLDE